MSLALTKQELCNIVKGRTLRDEARLGFERVEYDSREIRGGELFIALKGSAEHGHKHVESALARGAGLCLVEDETIASVSAHPERVVIVDDTLTAFWELARWWRRQLALPVLAITGSVGKTTTKEIAASILLRWGKGAYSQKSHNNHVGVPYTMCRMSREHRWAVLEMGMNHPGEIRELSKLAEPDVALITLIAPAHIEYFSGIDAICDAKFEIIEGLKRPGTVVLNRDDQVLCAGWKRHMESGLKPAFFGTSTECDSHVENVRAFGFEGIEFDLVLFSERLAITMRVIGRHHAISAAAAALAAKTLIPELKPAQIVSGLREFTAPLMRMAIKTLKGGRKLVDDSYNANPVSMGALLELAADMKTEKLRIGFLLGDMLELGARSHEYHTELGEKVAALAPEFLIAVGQQAQAYKRAAESKGVHAVDGQTPEAAAQIARKFDFDVLFVKASRGIGLDRAVKIIVDREGL